ncbi:MAG: PfkB family carbohydrate kinase, partial [Butyricicoccus sp.]
IKLIKTIKKAGCRLIVDEAEELLEEALKFEPDMVKPNIFELAEAVGDEPTVDPDVLVVSARKLLDKGAQAVCVSMGEEGALFVSKQEPEALYVNCNPKIYNEGAVGTGDAMVGAIANAMDKKISFVEMAKFTVATGRACARLAGTEMATLKKVYEVYENLLVYTV